MLSLISSIFAHGFIAAMLGVLTVMAYEKMLEKWNRSKLLWGLLLLLTLYLSIIGIGSFFMMFVFLLSKLAGDSLPKNAINIISLILGLNIYFLIICFFIDNKDRKPENSDSGQ